MTEQFRFANRFILGTFAFAHLGDKDVDDILYHYFSSNGLWVDTAPFYGQTRVEALLGSFVRRYQPEVRVATKVGYFLEPTDYLKPDTVEISIERSIDRLHTVPTMISLHEADWRTWWERGQNPGSSLARPEAINVENSVWPSVCEFAKRCGANPGITGNHAEVLLVVAQKIGCPHVTVAKQYDLLWRSAESLIAWAVDNGVSIWCAAPFHQGALLNLRALREEAFHVGDWLLGAAATDVASLLEANHLHVADAAVSYLFGDQRIDGVVIGVKCKAELDSALRASVITLPAEVRKSLQHLGVARPPRGGIDWLPRPCQAGQSDDISKVAASVTQSSGSDS